MREKATEKAPAQETCLCVLALLYVCVCVCICTYVYIYIYIYIDTHSTHVHGSGGQARALLAAHASTRQPSSHHVKPNSKPTVGNAKAELNESWALALARSTSQVHGKPW